MKASRESLTEVASARLGFTDAGSESHVAKQAVGKSSKGALNDSPRNVSASIADAEGGGHGLPAARWAKRDLHSSVCLWKPAMGPP